MKYLELKLHLEALSLELEKLKKENKELRDNLSKWKDSWFYLKDLYAGLWWNHPAISDDNELEYFRNNLKKLGK